MNGRERRIFDNHQAREISRAITTRVLAERRQQQEGPGMSITYNEQHQARERYVNSLRWAYGWSPSKRKAWITDSKGFTVIGPVLSAQAAAELCRQHNSTIERAVA